MIDEKYDSQASYSFKMDQSVSRIRSSYFVIMDSFTIWLTDEPLCLESICHIYGISYNVSGELVKR